MDEFELIRRVVAELGEQTQAPQVVLGPGDDAAIIAPTPDWHMVASIDTQVADRHFPRTAPAELIGYRAVMASVSDLAAMAARPVYMLVALMLDEVDADWVMALTRGMKAAANDCQIALCGGNFSRGPLALTLSVHGEVPAGGGLLRSGARVGDVIQVSGPLGGAGACVRAGEFAVTAELSLTQQRYFRPRARVDLSEQLRDTAHAAIDVSDGLLQDLQHLLTASQVGADLEAANIPVCPGASLEDALHGGEDYELLVAASTTLDGFTAIGRVVAQPSLTLDGRVVEARGYDHFRDAP
ncbi:MAG: thiamine-phosphate kinase [Pseudomonadales bacterium]